MEEDVRQTLREALPAARVKIFAGLGHNPFWEDPQQVAAAINGSRIHVLTRPDSHNQHVERRLKDAMSDAGLSGSLNWKAKPTLPRR